MITTETTLQLPLSETWQLFTQPYHIEKWFHSTDEWHCTSATNNLVEEGEFSFRMEKRKGSEGFNFAGTYKEIKPLQEIFMRLEDGRTVQTQFLPVGEKTIVRQTFEPETVTDKKSQQKGWQMILDNLNSYAETIKEPTE